MTPEQYLEIERASEIRHEYFDGQMFAMAGGIYPHARLAWNLSGELYIAFRDGRCHAGSSDLRVRTSGSKLYAYPDIVVVCGEAVMPDDRSDTLLNPTLIVEVLSESTEAMDGGIKFHQYRRIESLMQYVLISQTEPLIEVFSRGADGDWTLKEYAGIDSVCRLASAGCEVPLSVIYKGVWPDPRSQRA